MAQPGRDKSGLERPAGCYPACMLKHVSFVTPDAGRIARFYAALGASVTKDLVTSEGWRRLVLSFEGGGRLQFFEVQAAQEPPIILDHPNHPAPAGPVGAPHSWMEHVAVVVPDLTALAGRLRQDGVPFSRELGLSPTGKPMAFVLDPDGRQVELLEAEG